MTVLSFWVDGVPRTKGSAKAFTVRNRAGGYRAVVTNDNVKTKAWQHTVASQARAVLPPGTVPSLEAVIVKLVFALPRPLRLKAGTTHRTRPDLDKLVRPVLDGLTGIVIRDDGQVAVLTAQKRYAAPGCGPGVDITVSTNVKREDLYDEEA